MDPETQVGPLSEEALQDILDQVKRFEKAGAKLPQVENKFF
jgi:succinate-semialdehyde dehydrogenase/glutarate-semialdehyde dehydrogenase